MDFTLLELAWELIKIRHNFEVSKVFVKKLFAWVHHYFKHKSFAESFSPFFIYKMDAQPEIQNFNNLY